MDLSSEWKALFPISTVHAPPLLLSGPSSKPILGPLLFNPIPQTLTLLISSPSLFSHSLPPPLHLTLPRFLHASSSLPPSTPSSVASLLGPLQNDAASHLLHNHLSFLQLPCSNSLLIFFPTNSEQVGFLKLSVNNSGSGFDVRADKNSDVFRERTGFEYQIIRISINPTVGTGAILAGNSGSYVSVGYVMASTLYSVHWFVVKVKGLGLSPERPGLVCLGSKVFKSCYVVWACWSPHLLEESVVLLEIGELFLFDLESCSKAGASNAHFRGTRLRVPWDDDSGAHKWLCCEFSWHPRILVVVWSNAVFLVDLRFDECVVSCLAKVEMLRLYANVKNEQFLTFTMVDCDPFCFVLASDSLLILCDVRKPMVPVLQWGHGLDKPCYIDVFRLTELRSNSRDDTYRWASESGFCIIWDLFGIVSLISFAMDLLHQPPEIALLLKF